MKVLQPEVDRRPSREPGSAAARLHLVGDYKLFRECLASMIETLERFEITGQSSDLEGVSEALRVQGVDVVLLDVGRPHEAIFQAVKELTEAHPELKLIVMGLEEEGSEILRFVEAGASAYVLKEASVNELGLVIDRVLRGEVACSPKVASTMFSRLADLARARRREERLEALNLTSRELEILRLVADGLSNKQIAARLYLSFHTVKNHVHHILEKLKVQHRSQAVEYAARRRWLKIPEHGSGEPRSRF